MTPEEPIDPQTNTEDPETGGGDGPEVTPPPPTPIGSPYPIPPPPPPKNALRIPFSGATLITSDFRIFHRA